MPCPSSTQCVLSRGDLRATCGPMRTNQPVQAMRSQRAPLGKRRVVKVLMRGAHAKALHDRLRRQVQLGRGGDHLRQTLLLEPEPKHLASSLRGRALAPVLPGQPVPDFHTGHSTQGMNGSARLGMVSPTKPTKPPSHTCSTAQSLQPHSSSSAAQAAMLRSLCSRVWRPGKYRITSGSAFRRANAGLSRACHWRRRRRGVAR